MSPADDKTRVAAQAIDEHMVGNALPIGSRIGEFELTGIVGEGGFGIVYLAYDHSLERSVALKEYMPSSLASRVPDSSEVRIKTQRNAETFKAGLRSFVNEAKVLAQFDHPALVKVYRFWEQNGTAYMVMPYYEGITLKDWLRERGEPPDEETLKRLLGPVLEALDVIHRAQIYHRDIAPDNILLLEGDRPLLLDFGAARRVIGDMTQALTVILKPGYAPIEQYAEVPGMKQGAFTDIYALGALVYYAIVGRTPPPSVARMVNDSMEPLTKQCEGRYSQQFLAGLDKCLAVKQEDRPQSIREMWDLLGIYQEFTQVLPRTTAPDDRARRLEEIDRNARSPMPMILGGLAVVAAAGAGAWYFLGAGADPVPPPAVVAQKSEPKPPVDAPKAPAKPVEPAPDATPPADTPPGNDTPPVEAKPVVSSPPAVTPPKATPVAPPKVVEAPKPPPAPPTVAAVDPVQALQAIYQGRDRARNVAVDVSRTRVRIGKDRPSFRVRSTGSGFLYVMMVGTDSEHLMILFPNSIDKDNRITAGSELTLPRSGWTFVAGGPAGTNHLVAMVSDAPRDFSGAGIEHGEPFDEFPLARIAALAKANDGKLDFMPGVADCAGASSCSQGYGAALFSIEEIN
ncbi:MAG: protein kinase [Rhodocyclaceae bacterium]|nr:protein kinase [Rhodocyclaceae bacterium]